MALRKTLTKTKKSSRLVRKPKAVGMANSMKPAQIVGFLFFGLLFGYFLSKSQATDYDAMMDMFRFKSTQLWGVIGMAIFIVSAGLLLLQWLRKPTASGKPLDWKPMNFIPERILGALVFGVGWALTGVCPGTALVQLGEGKVMAIATVLGISVGTWLYGKFPRVEEKNEEVC
jgi:hypothetical protein